ncbi:MAG: carbamate kinase, partial [Thaumarchaeota archaeon]|nr:carbamate kinase [Nitrososphaerota archaeon]
MKILVALGGNAILQHKERGTAEEQFSNVRRACVHLVDIIEDGHHLVITHGNGPQVGDILLKDEMAKAVLPQMPLDVCGAESQGMIGYMIQRSLREELRSRGIETRIATILTETVVDPEDVAFKAPSKPIGPFYTAMEASKLKQQRGWTMVNDSGRGYRRVVPSPKPLSIVESPTIHDLVDAGVIVIAAGGGGIPVASAPDGSIKGVEAVIDKDLAASALATTVGADMLLILTDVENIFLDYGKPTARALTRLTRDECMTYLKEGQFAPGSMGPKVEAAVAFIDSGGKSAAVTTLENSREA